MGVIKLVKLCSILFYDMGAMEVPKLCSILFYDMGVIKLVMTQRVLLRFIASYIRKSCSPQ